MSKRVRFRFTRLGSRLYRQLVEYLDKVLKVNPRSYLPDKLYMTCFDKYCIVHEEAGRDEHVTLLYSGEWYGLVVNGKAYLSTYVYERVYAEHGYKAAIVVGEKGVKNFLYGRDVLEESIVERFEPLNNPVAVLDFSDYRVIGVVEPSRRGVYKHVYDLSLFLHILG